MDGSISPGPCLSLILPAFNEADGIRQAVAEAITALTRFTRAFEILVIDDGSSDATADIVAGIATDRPQVRLIRHETNLGYSAALRTGFSQARYELVAFTDADCQFDLADLEPLVHLASQHPIAVGYRVDRQDPWQRQFYSWGYNKLVRALLGTGVRDCDCALKVFRRDVVRQLLPTQPGYFANAEMLTRARQMGLQVAERGVKHRPRQFGQSKVSLRDIPRTLGTLIPFWWSQVVFAGKTEADTAPGRSLPVWELGLVLVVALFLFFGRLHLPLQEPEESRYAEIPRQMLEANSWTIPLLHGQPYYDKPPLLYWLVMISYKMNGIHDWAARLVMSLAGLGTVLVIFAWGCQISGRRAGLAAALCLCLSARFLYLERLVTMNGLLALCTTTALAAGYAALSGSRFRWSWWVVAAVAFALGLLTKGAVVFALVAVPACLWMRLDQRGSRPGWPAYLLFIAIVMSLAGPWFVCAQLRDPEFASYFLWKHHVVRYLAPFDHSKPMWYYLRDVSLGLFPGTVLLWPLLVLLIRPRRVATFLPSGLGYVLLVAVWGMAFFSLAGSKRAGYILPIMPLVALACGVCLDVLLRSTEPRLRALAGHLGKAATLLVVATAMASAIFTTAMYGRDLRDGLYAVAGFMLILAICLPMLRRVGPSGAWNMCAGATLAALLVGMQTVLPMHAQRYAMRNQVRAHLAAAQDPSLPVACYPRGWDSVSFYLNRTDVRVYTATMRDTLMADFQSHPRTLLFLKTDGYCEEFLESLPASLEFLEQGRRGEVTVGWIRPRPTDDRRYFLAGESAWAGAQKIREVTPR